MFTAAIGGALNVLAKVPIACSCSSVITSARMAKAGVRTLRLGEGAKQCEGSPRRVVSGGGRVSRLASAKRAPHGDRNSGASAHPGRAATRQTDVQHPDAKRRPPVLPGECVDRSAIHASMDIATSTQGGSPPNPPSTLVKSALKLGRAKCKMVRALRAAKKGDQ